MSKPRRLLLMPPNWIGDVIMAQPCMRAIADYYGDSTDTVKISLVGQPWLRDLLPYLNLASAQYRAKMPRADMVIIFPNSFSAAWKCLRAGIARRIGYRGQWRRGLLTNALPRRKSMLHEHHRDFYLDIAAQMHIPVPASDVRLYAPEGAEDAGRRIMLAQGLAPERVYCIAPGARFGAAKCYPSEGFAAVVRSLAEAGWQPLVLGMPEDRRIGEQLLANVQIPHWNAAGSTTLSEALQLISASRLMLCNDSGLMHVAAGLGKPTVAPFGATDPARTAPGGPEVRILYQPAECSPCLQRECSVADHPCMRNITTDMLSKACLSMLPE
jgi:heptosyltransferase-2